MLISIRAEPNRRTRTACEKCGMRANPPFRCYGAACQSDPPYVIRICRSCVLDWKAGTSVIDPEYAKLEKALAVAEGA